MDLPNKSYLCVLCNVDFGNRQTLRRHNRNFHDPSIILNNQRARGKLSCGVCKNFFRKQSDLCQHVDETHQIAAKIETAQFESIKEFLKWKNDQERRGDFKFSLRSSRIIGDQSKYKKQIFYCHRSGDYVSKNGGKPRKKGSLRCGFQCTAFVEAKIDTNTDQVTITYCLDHYVHDKWIRAEIPEPPSLTISNQLEESNDGNDTEPPSLTISNQLEESDEFNDPRTNKKITKRSTKASEKSKATFIKKIEKCSNLLSLIKDKKIVDAAGVKINELHDLLKAATIDGKIDDPPILSTEVVPVAKVAGRQNRSSPKRKKSKKGK